MTANEKYVKGLLAKDRSKLTKSELEYLQWKGAIGPGALLKEIIKEQRKCISK